METTLTASILTRLSKKASAANLSLDGGLQDCRVVAAELNARVVEERVDNGVSGKIRLRKGLQAWLEDARSGHADVLLAPHSDRITRTGLTTQSGQIMDLLRGLDPESGKQVRTPIRLVTVSSSDGGRIDTSLPGGLEKLEQEFAAAAVELRRITQRNKQTRQRMIAAGRYMGGGPPMGAKVVIGDDGLKRLARDDDEAEWLQEASSRLLRGDTWHSVLRWSNGIGRRTRRGYSWSRPSLQKTLTSDACRDYVLDPSTWRAVQEFMAARKKAPARAGRPSIYLLIGGPELRGFCSGCGAIVGVFRSNGRANYRCSAHAAGQPCPAPIAIVADRTDQILEAEFLATYGDDPESDVQVVVVGGADIEAAHRDVDSSLEDFKNNPTAERAEVYAAAQKRLKALESEPRRREVSMRLTGRTVAEAWSSASVRERRSMLAECLVNGKVVIGPAAARGARDVQGRLDLTWLNQINPDDPDWFEPS